MNCPWASLDRSARQRMFHVAPGLRLAAFELGFAAPYDLRLGGSESVVGINQAFGLDEHAVLPLGERHKVPLPDVQGFEHLARNDHLTPLAHAADPLLSCG